MKYNIVITIALILASITSVSATVTSRNCTDSWAWENTTWYFNGTEYPFDSEPVYCKYGCADNGLECAEPIEYDSGMLLTVGVILGIIAFIFAYIAKSVQWGGEKYSWPLQVLFLFGCILFILLDVGIVAGFSTFTQNEVKSILNVGYMSVTYFLWLTLGFFLILLIIKAVEYMTSGGGDEEQANESE